MPTSFGILKGALRSYSGGDYIHALLELKALINESRDCWTAYLVKGKVNAALNRYEQAIADYSLVLEMSQSLNERNRRQIVQSIALCSTKLSARQRADLAKYFQKGPPPPPVKKRGGGSRVICTSETGKIAHLGKFLIDARDMEKLEQLVLLEGSGDSRVHVLSREAGLAFRALLQKIDKQPGVVGSCIIGRDFFLRASTLPEDYDAEPFGINALTVFLSVRDKVNLFGDEKEGHVLARTELGYLIIVELDDLVLITLSNEKVLSKLLKLARKTAKFVDYR